MLSTGSVHEEEVSGGAKGTPLEEELDFCFSPQTQNKDTICNNKSTKSSTVAKESHMADRDWRCSGETEDVPPGSRAALAKNTRC